MTSFIARLYRAEPARVALVLGLQVGLGLIEGASLLLLVPLLQLVGLDVGQGATGRVAEAVSRVLSTVGLQPTLGVVLVAYVVIVSIHALLHRSTTVASSSLGEDFATVLRRHLYRAISEVRWPFFVQMRSSSLTHALTSEVDRVGTATYYLLALVATAIVAGVYLILALAVSIPMTALALAAGVLLAILLSRQVWQARRRGHELSEATDALYGAAVEHLGGMKLAHTYNATPRMVERFFALTQQVGEVSKRSTHGYAQVQFWREIGSAILLCGILYVALTAFALSTAELLVLLFLFYRLVPRIGSIQEQYQYFINALPAFDAIERLQSQMGTEAVQVFRNETPVRFRTAVQLHDVSFSYGDSNNTPTAKTDVDDRPFRLHDIDLTIACRRTVAVVGPSGAGKSTIAHLILGLIEPDRGHVCVDDQPLGSENVRSWRDHIGYVGQDLFLFHDTVRANLLWARPNASDEEIWDALHLAAMDALIRGLPAGLETVVGDRGVRFSGGERQRLALAQALLRRPALLILDEATSSLDAENQQRIESAIEQLHARMTILLITHRLASVRSADTIYVVETGRVVESGTWDTLMAKPGGRFRTMYQAQGIDMLPEPLLGLVSTPDSAEVGSAATAR